jgi:dynein heavy chain, axonemal
MEQATQEKYLKISTKIDDAVTELSVIDQKMKEAENNMEKYTQYEEILGVQEPANFQAVLDAREELNLRYHMWKGINEFGNLNKEWAKIPFKDVDAKKIANQTEMYARIVNKCKKNLAENKVLNLLMDPVMAYKATMPVVTALRSKYLTE